MSCEMLFFKKKTKIECVYSKTGHCVKCAYKRDGEIIMEDLYVNLCYYCRQIVACIERQRWKNKCKQREEEKRQKFAELKNALKQALIEIENERANEI